MASSTIDRLLVHWLCHGRIGDDTTNALHAISDGTPEHLSLWGVPLLLGMTWKAFTEISPKWGVGAGLMAVLVALDSPYHAIYAALTGLIVLPWSFIRRWKIEERLDFVWTIGSLLTICVAGAAMMAALYSFFPLGESSTGRIPEFMENECCRPACLVAT